MEEAKTKNNTTSMFFASPIAQLMPGSPSVYLWTITWLSPMAWHRLLPIPTLAREIRKGKVVRAPVTNNGHRPISFPFHNCVTAPPNWLRYYPGIMQETSGLSNLGIEKEKPEKLCCLDVPNQGYLLIWGLSRNMVYLPTSRPLQCYYRNSDSQ